MTPFATGIDKISITTHKSFDEVVNHLQALGIFVESHQVIEDSEPVAYVPTYFSTRNYTDVYQFKLSNHSYVHVLRHKDSNTTDISFSGLYQYKKDGSPMDTLPEVLSVLKSLISAEFYPVLKGFDVAFDFKAEYSSFVETNIDQSSMINFKGTLYSHKRNERGQLPTNSLCIYDKTQKNKLDTNITRVEFRKRLQKSSRVLLQDISDLEAFIKKQEKKVHSLIALYFYNPSSIIINSIQLSTLSFKPSMIPINYVQTQSPTLNLLSPKIVAITEHPSQVIEIFIQSYPSFFYEGNTLHHPPNALELVAELTTPSNIHQILKDEHKAIPHA